MLRLDSDVNQLMMLAEQLTIKIRTPQLVRADGNHGRKFSSADLPDVEIGYDRIAIALHRAANFGRQIGSCRRAIEQNATGITQQTVSPRKDDSTTDDADDGVEPSPAEKFPGSQGDDGKAACEGIG